jgi:hypothetical protein
VRAAAGVEGDFALLAAVGTDHDARQVGRAVGERKVVVEIEVAVAGTVAGGHPLRARSNAVRA